MTVFSHSRTVQVSVMSSADCTMLTDQRLEALWTEVSSSGPRHHVNAAALQSIYLLTYSSESVIRVR